MALAISKQRARAARLALHVRVEARVLVADGDLPRDGLEERDLLVVPVAHGARHVEADEAEHVAVEDDRHDEQRARAEALRQEADARVEVGRGDVVEADGAREVEALDELADVHVQDGAEARRHVLGGAPLVADAQLARRRQLQHVAAVNLHHPPEFGDDGAQEAVEVDLRMDVRREAVDDRLARLVHPDLALDGERLRWRRHKVCALGRQDLKTPLDEKSGARRSRVKALEERTRRAVNASGRKGFSPRANIER